MLTAAKPVYPLLHRMHTHYTHTFVLADATRAVTVLAPRRVR